MCSIVFLLFLYIQRLFLVLCLSVYNTCNYYITVLYSDFVIIKLWLQTSVRAQLA